MRLFIAINFDNEIKKKFTLAQDRLKQFTKGNFSHTENIHLTLVFLGEVEPERVPPIQQAMQSVTVHN